MVGGLLSAHLLLTDDSLYPDARLPGYDNELLDLARDLTDRLSDAFQGSESGLPYPRVNLRYGVQLQAEKMFETCLAGAGSLILEFGVLSRLSDDPVYERLADKAVKNLWNRRSSGTGLFGNTIDVRHGEWIDNTSGEPYLWCFVGFYFQCVVRATMCLYVFLRCRSWNGLFL